MSESEPVAPMIAKCLSNSVTVSEPVDAQGSESAPAKWISVKDRLPTSQGRYRIMDHQEEHISQLSWDMGNKPQWAYDCPHVGGGYYFSVTHWQPLPSPPQLVEHREDKSATLEVTQGGCNAPSGSVWLNPNNAASAGEPTEAVKPATARDFSETYEGGILGHHAQPYSVWLEFAEAYAASLQPQVAGLRLAQEFVAELLSPDATPRCPICFWPLAESAKKGCVLGNCSYRPDTDTERARIRNHRASYDKTLAVAMKYLDQAGAHAPATPEGEK